MLGVAMLLVSLTGLGPTPQGREPTPDSMPQGREPTPVVALTWTAPPECPAADEVHDAVQQLVGRPLGQDASRTLRVEASVEQTETGYVLDLRMSDAVGTSTRRLEDAACQRLLEPVAVIVAVAVDPWLSDEEARRVPDPPPPASPGPPSGGVEKKRSASHEPISISAVDSEPEPFAVPPAEGVRESRDNRQVRAALGVRGGVGGANLPGVGGIVEGSIGAGFEHLRLDLAVIHLFSHRRERPGGAGGRFSVTAVRPEGCWTPGPSRLRFPVCVGPEIGLLRAEGIGVSSREVVRRTWLAIVTGPGIAWSPVRRLALRVRVDLVFQTLRREFTLSGGTLFTTPIAGVRGLAGLEVVLP